MTRWFVGMIALAVSVGCANADRSGQAATDASTGEDAQGDETPAWCGDGVVDDGEACELGIGNEVGADCTATCELPRCGDGILTPLEACDGAAAADRPSPGPWSCAEDCQWRSPTVWVDDWADQSGHDDVAMVVEPAGDGTFRALGWQDGEAGPQWLLRMLDAQGARIWSRALDAGACGNSSPWLGVSGDLAAALTFPCTGEATVVQAFDSEGTLAWSNDGLVPESAGAGLWGSAAGFAVYSSSLADDVVRFDLQFIDPEGELVWKVALDDPLWTTVADDTTLYGAGSETVWSRRLSDGALVDSAPLPSSSACAALDGRGRLVLARQPGNLSDPFRLESFDAAFDVSWSVDLGDPPNSLRRRYGVDAGGGRIVLALEQQDPRLGAFDSYAGVLIFDESGAPLGQLALQGSGHGRDFAVDVAITAEGHVVAAGARSRAGSGLDGFVARLDEDVAGESPSAVPLPSPPRPPAEHVRPVGAVPKTVFIDTAGPALRTGLDPSLAEVSCIDGAFGFPALGWDPAEVQLAIAGVQDIFAPFAVRFVSEPPPTYLPYTRVFVGGDPESLGSADGHRGLACVIDCGDATWVESLFVFGEAAGSPEELTQTIAHEFGHALGLDHIDEPGDLMNPISSGQNTDIEDGCRALLEDGCAMAHASHCGEDRQNSHAELLAALGSPTADLDPPSIIIEAPRSSAARDPIVVVVRVSDATPGFGWQLSVPELGWRSAGSTAGRESVEIYLPPGDWTLEVDAMDQYGNGHTAAVELAVER